MGLKVYMVSGSPHAYIVRDISNFRAAWSDKLYSITEKSA